MFAHYLANRFVLKPTRQPLSAEGMLRRRVVVESNGWIEATVYRLRQGQMVSEHESLGIEDDPPHDKSRVHSKHLPDVRGLHLRASSRAASSPPPACENELDYPALLVAKFPGTAGRAERSTPFPAHLTQAVSAEVWTWNPPGYGGSPGRATLGGIANAASEFLRALWRQRGGPETRLWVCGNSLGCASGIYAARALTKSTQADVHGLILRNPPPLISLISSRDAWWNLRRGGRYVARGVPEEMDAVAQIRELHAPALFFESTADRIVPPRFQAEIRNAHRGPQRTMKIVGGDHATPLAESQHGELVEHLEWLWRGGRATC